MQIPDLRVQAGKTVYKNRVKVKKTTDKQRDDTPYEKGFKPQNDDDEQVVVHQWVTDEEGRLIHLDVET